MYTRQLIELLKYRFFLLKHTNTHKINVCPDVGIELTAPVLAFMFTTTRPTTQSDMYETLDSL